jgi:hypothetical protein
VKIYNRNELLPRFWWLFPWATARELHRIAKASLNWGDDADLALDLQSRVIADQSAEISRLRLRLEDLNEDILRGRAITPDAYPFNPTPTPEAPSPAKGQQEAKAYLPVDPEDPLASQGPIRT